MAIGDLLAQITGEKPPAPKPKPAIAARPAPIPKRRADDDISNEINKAPRLSASGSSTSPTTSSMPSTTSKPLDRRPSTQIPSRPPNGSDATKSAMATTRSPMNRVQSGRITKPTAPSRPTLPVGSSTASAKAPPKKRSYAEIMARATLAQQTMAQVGGIRHKPVEQTVKKDDKPSETTRLASSSTKPGGPSSTNGQLKRSNTMPAATPRNGTAVTNTSTPRNGTTGTSIMRPGKGSGNTQSKDVKRNGTKAPPPEPEKKIKKAALATTGYTGTARPTTAPATKGKPADASTRAGLVNPHGSRSPKSSSASRYRRRDEDEDEELDDFIEYDDEEDEGPGPKRYEHYDSDGSSDMEAGLDDIDGEEEYAARMARREDEAEEAALRQAKLLKERRKMEFAKRRAHRAA